MQPLPPAIGRYEVRQRIGQGGMGALFLALDPAIDRLVALKLLRVDNEETRARFLREARSAGRLQHPHIVTVYDVGEHQGQPFIAMEYVKGETLGEVIGRRAPLSIAGKLTLMEDLCAGLDYAHDEGLVHRDIKPANLMVTSGTEGLKILDFGIARSSGDSGLTEVGTMIGTPNYMSPEQASGKSVDQRSDIFAVGAVIYEMLAYQQAFPGKEWQVVLPNILNQSPAPLTQVDTSLDPRLNDIVSKALARDPTARYQSLKSLGRDLADFRQQVVGTHADTTMPVPTPLPVGGRKPRPATDSNRLDSLRKAKVMAHVEAAHASLDRGDIDSAQLAAEEASLLDVDDTQVVKLLEVLSDAQDEHRFNQHLRDAREQLASEALTEALNNVDQALELQPAAAAALDLRQTLVEAFDERARRRERAQLIDRALIQAREGLKAGSPEAALRAASEVLVWDPNHVEAATLKRRALKATEGRRRQEATDRKTRHAIELARREFEEGDHTAAFERLEPLRGTHPLVVETLSALRAKAAEIARSLESDAAVQQRSEEWVAEQLAAVRAAIVDERWDDGAAQVQELRARAPRTPDLASLSDEVERGQLAARRQAEVERFLGDARFRKASEDYPGALARVDAALALWDDHTEAIALREEIEELAVAADERREAEAVARRKTAQQAVNTWLDTADEALRSGRFDEALKALEDVDPAVATATQTARLRALSHDAEARRVEALEEAARQRQERREQIRQRFDTQLTTVVSVARRASMDRRFQVGGGLVVALAVVLWWMVPSGPQPAPTTTASTSPPEAVAADLSSVPDRPANPTAGSVVGAGLGGLPSMTAVSGDEGVDTVDADRPGPAVDPVQAALAAVLDLSSAGRFTDAFAQLDRLNQADGRVSRFRGQVERAWNGAGQEAAALARQLSEAGDIGQALAVVGGFQPVHGFVEAARDDVEAAWAADGARISRRALEMAAGGDHDAAVALLEASDPPHESVVATLNDLRANPACSAELPSVSDALSAFRFESSAAVPQVVTAACDDSFGVAIQNELIRFGARCERASATAFVPVLCQGSSEWSDPFVLSFVLSKSGEDWVITESVELDADSQPSR